MRKIGALLGVHAGDSLGATLEFMPWEQVKCNYPKGHRSIIGGGPFNWPVGHATDDTDLTRAVLLAYKGKAKAEGPDYDVVRAAADMMLNWLDGNWPEREPGFSPVDIGNATAIGLGRYRKYKDPRNCGAGKGSAGNGSLMRCIPTALFVDDPAQRKKDSIEISAVTHNDPRCTIACAAYNEIVAALIQGVSPEHAVEAAIGYANKEANNPDVAKAIETGQSLNLQKLMGKGPGVFPGKATGYVLESLSLAVAAVLDHRSFVDVLENIVLLGGDTDTNGAIAGGLLGARDGVDAIPQAWIEKLQFGKEFIEAVKA